MSGTQSLSGQRVLVLGLGHSGLAMARWCAREGAELRVWDSRENPPQAQALALEHPQALRLSGPLGPQSLEGVSRVFKSPGLAPGDERIAPLLAAARERGIEVGAELDLFGQALDSLRHSRGYAPQVLAVTGTNGKTTTTALTALLVQRAGREAVAAGNIGPTLLDTLRERIETDRLPQVWVLELSSFQLHDAARFEPDAAVVLNLSQDHLDWHGSMSAYAQAKARVFGASALRVLNADDPAVMSMLPTPPAPYAPSAPQASPASAHPSSASGPRAGTPSRGSSASKAGARPPAPTVRHFGLGSPRHAGDFGLVDEGGVSWLVLALPGGEEPLQRRREASAPLADLRLQRLMPAEALRLRGRHNAANALAALALASAIGCPLAPMLHGLREYRGEPHRVESVGLIDGVEAFDDSKGTNVGATVAAISGLGADRAPSRIAVILGGDGKGQDFSALAAPVARHARAVALIGRDAPSIEQALQADPASASVARKRLDTLPEAVQWCFDQAIEGDAVLLSPACASFDMFRDYGHRAEVFVQAVRDRAHDRGALQ